LQISLTENLGGNSKLVMAHEPNNNSVMPAWSFVMGINVRKARQDEPVRGEYGVVCFDVKSQVSKIILFIYLLIRWKYPPTAAVVKSYDGKCVRGVTGGEMVEVGYLKTT